jgi:cytochrome P450
VTEEFTPAQLAQLRAIIREEVRAIATPAATLEDYFPLQAAERRDTVAILAETLAEEAARERAMLVDWDRRS